jgi:hypothetical protein
MEKMIAGSFIVIIGVMLPYMFFKLIKDVKELK